MARRSRQAQKAARSLRGRLSGTGPQNAGVWYPAPVAAQPLTVASAVVAAGAGSVIALAVSRSAATSVVPATTAFAVSSGHTVSAVAWQSATVLAITVTPSFIAGESRTLAYTAPGTNAIVAADGGELASFTAQAITNNVTASVGSGNSQRRPLVGMVGNNFDNGFNDSAVRNKAAVRRFGFFPLIWGCGAYFNKSYASAEYANMGEWWQDMRAQQAAQAPDGITPSVGPYCNDMEWPLAHGSPAPHSRFVPVAQRMNDLLVRPRGAWVAARAYAVRDLVTATVNGVAADYKCAVAHTSGTFASDLSAGRWVSASTWADGTQNRASTGFLLTAAGAIVPNSWGGNLNLTSATALVPIFDANGNIVERISVPRWIGRYYFDTIFGRVAGSPYGDMQGLSVCTDNGFWRPRYNGDWRLDGSTISPATVKDWPDGRTEDVQTQWRRGYAAGWDEIRSLMQSRLGKYIEVCPNIEKDTLLTEAPYPSFFDWALMEAVYGGPWYAGVAASNVANNAPNWGTEYASSPVGSPSAGFQSGANWRTTTGRVRTARNNTKQQRVIAQTYANSSTAVAGQTWAMLRQNRDEMRYNLASCMMSKGVYSAYNPGTGMANSGIQTGPVIFDEYRFPMGEMVGAEPSISGTDATLAAEYDNGCAVVNLTTTAQTIYPKELFGGMKGRWNGALYGGANMDPDINSGADFSTTTNSGRGDAVVIQPKSGILLRRN